MGCKGKGPTRKGEKASRLASHQEIHMLSLFQRKRPAVAAAPSPAPTTDLPKGLIWPESAFPFILARDAAALTQIGAALKGKTHLITGAAREGGGGDFYNAIQVVGPNGTILDSVDKVHLVPFGEYMPFPEAFRALGIASLNARVADAFLNGDAALGSVAADQGEL